jgi:outer membrane protein
MFMKLASLTKMAGCLLVFTFVASGAEFKIAVVDMTKVMDAHPRDKANRAIIDKQITDLKNEINKLQEESDAYQEQLDKMRKDISNPALSKEARDKAIKAAEEKYMEYREHDKKARETIMMRENQIREQNTRMREELISKIKGIIQEYAEKHGYSLVMDSSGTGLNGVESVVFAIPALDITSDIIKLIEQQEKEKKK